MSWITEQVNANNILSKVHSDNILFYSLFASYRSLQ